MTGISHPAWTDAEVATLRTHWAAGWSASQCAEILPGKTRNAILGKTHRLALPYRSPMRIRPARPAGTPTPPRAPRQPKTAKATTEPPQPRQPASPPITFAKLRRSNVITQCRYPIGPVTDTATTLYCGTPTAAGSSYCAYHHARCWKPYVPRKREATA